jgi:ubiquinone/menaquinone biosynthesis C-methylase UbiE
MMYFFITEVFKVLGSYVLVNGQTIRWLTEKRVVRGMIPGGTGKYKLAVDVGCGGGMYAVDLLAPAAERVVALDLHPPFTRLARRRAFRRGLGHVDVILASAEALPIRSCVVDLILCTQVLEHLPRDDLALSEFARVARRDALLVLSVPHPPDPVHNPGHIREGYTLEQICQLLRVSGFEIEQARFCLFWISRFVFRLVSIAGIPLPLMFLVIFERLIANFINLPAPWAVVLRARRRV